MNDTKLVEDSATRRPPAAGMGRPKGALNKTTKAAKDAIAQAAEELGGTDRLVAWVKEDPSNERVFWGTIYPKLLPLQLNGAGENGEHLFTGIKVEFVNSGNSEVS
jgi:hypothetical protein